MKRIFYSACKRHTLFVFFVAAYIITWVLWAPSIAASRGLLPQLPRFLSVIGSFGPALAAILVTSVIDGKDGVFKLLKKLIQWRAGPVWYLVAFIPLLINALLLAIYSILSGNTAEFGITTFAMFIPAFLFWLVVGGPLGEELGWRGFALPRLQRTKNPLQSAIYLALVWFGWHLPRYLDPQMATGGVIAIAIFGFQALVFSILFTWLYNNSNGNLLIVTVFHATINSLGYLFPMVFPTVSGDELGVYFNLLNLIWLGLFAVWALFVIIRRGPGRLGKGPQSISS